MKQITEKDKLQDEWYEEAKNMTMDKLPEFLRRLTEDYGHDYGTICHAISAAAIGAAWATERTPQGGITGFQAGCIMWGFIQHWMSYKDQPLRLVKYEDMLYPQYRDAFEKTISQDTWDWLQQEAATQMQKSGSVSKNVRAHWESIIAGTVPFGYTIKNDDES
ncbi:MAG: hypothetical protein DRJ03_19095 [Chloroflexi bacterium]|nr:MAG: hypothetical protein DRJ03_19095 [Chloroflexota bacterium]